MEQVRQETESPPSRGAWIEIADTFRLLAKSHTSPPSRGAWIEICVWGGARMTHTVAPLAGGVD